MPASGASPGASGGWWPGELEEEPVFGPDPWPEGRPWGCIALGIVFRVAFSPACMPRVACTGRWAGRESCLRFAKHLPSLSDTLLKF